MNVRLGNLRIGALALAAMTGAVACGGSEATETPVAGVTAVTVEAARVDTLRDIVSMPGTVVPASATDWSVTAPETSRIAELPKAEGDAVEAGEILVRLEIPSVRDELAQRDLELSEARSRLVAARDEVGRLAPLHERGVIARNMFDTAKAAAAAAEAAVAQAEGRLELAKQGADRGTLRARFPGIVIKRFHLEGEFVAGTATDPILRVIDPNKIQIAAQVSLSQFARILPGQSATVQAGGGPPEAASVVQRTPPTDAQALTTEIRLGLLTATALAIDMPVQVEMILDERRDIIVVPTAAVRRDAEGAYVMVAGDDGLAHRREVRTGLAARLLTQVQGLVAGERVITTDLEQLADGAKITVR